MPGPKEAKFPAFANGDMLIFVRAYRYNDLGCTTYRVLFFFRLRLGSFEGPANGKPPALPEVADC
jgi:hypothetical protein